MSTLSSISEIVRGWTAPERKQALAEIVRDLAPADGAPLVIEGVGYLVPQPGQTVPVVFDDSTDYLREMRRRAETPEESDVILELDLPESPPEERPES